MTDVSSSGATAETATETTRPATVGGTNEDDPAAEDGTGVARGGSSEDGKVAREGEGGGEEDGGGGREGEATRGEQRGALSAARTSFSRACSP